MARQKMKTERKKCSFDMEVAFYKKVSDLAWRRRVTFSVICREALDAYMKKS